MNLMNKFHSIEQANLYRDASTISQLGQIISNHGMHHQLAVSLLHKHYDIPTNAVMTRTSNNSDAIHVEPRQYKDRYVPCHWSYDRSLGWVAVEFIDPLKWQASITPVTTSPEATPDLFNEFSNFLERIDATATYGLMTLHAFHALDVDPKKNTIHETTYQNGCGSQISIKKPNYEADPIEALWLAEPDSLTGNNKPRAIYICYGCTTSEH